MCVAFNRTRIHDIAIFFSLILKDHQREEFFCTNFGMFADMVILILEQILAFVREIPTDQNGGK